MSETYILFDIETCTDDNDRLHQHLVNTEYIRDWEEKKQASIAKLKKEIESLKTEKAIATREDAIEELEASECPKPEEFPLAEKAGLNPIASRIFCIAWKVVTVDNGGVKEGLSDLLIESQVAITGDEEFEVIAKFANTLADFPHAILVGFNIRKFDVPYLAARMLANGMYATANINRFLNGPYNMNVIDLMEILKGPNSYVKQDHVCASFGIETQDGIMGKDVQQAYVDGRYDEITKHCELDIDQLDQICETIGLWTSH